MKVITLYRNIMQGRALAPTADKAARIVRLAKQANKQGKNTGAVIGKLLASLASLFLVSMAVGAPPRDTIRAYDKSNPAIPISPYLPLPTAPAPTVAPTIAPKPLFVAKMDNRTIGERIALTPKWIASLTSFAREYNGTVYVYQGSTLVRIIK